MGGGRWGHYLCNLQEEYLKIHKIAFSVVWDFCGFYDLEAIFASLSGTAQSPWLSLRVWFVGLGEHFGEIATKNT